MKNSGETVRVISRPPANHVPGEAAKLHREEKEKFDLRRRHRQVLNEAREMLEVIFQEDEDADVKDVVRRHGAKFFELAKNQRPNSPRNKDLFDRRLNILNHLRELMSMRVPMTAESRNVVDQLPSHLFEAREGHLAEILATHLWIQARHILQDVCDEIFINSEFGDRVGGVDLIVKAGDKYLAIDVAVGDADRKINSDKAELKEEGVSDFVAHMKDRDLQPEDFFKVILSIPNTGGEASKMMMEYFDAVARGDDPPDVLELLKFLPDLPQKYLEPGSKNTRDAILWFFEKYSFIKKS